MLCSQSATTRKLQLLALTAGVLLLALPEAESSHSVAMAKAAVPAVTKKISVQPVTQAAGLPSAEAMKNWESNPFPYTEQVEVVATGYFAGKESTGKTPGHPQYGITYSGVKVRKGTFSTIAADPSVFPIGTVLFIPGYGYGVVADTGGAIKGNKIDLFFETKDDIYKQWGKRTVKVNVLARGEGSVTEAMLDRLNAIESVMALPSASP